MKLTDEDKRRRDLFREWIRSIQAETGSAPSTLATAAGVAPSTINRPMNQDDARAPKWATILKVAEAAGVSPPAGLNPDPPSESRPATVDEPATKRHHRAHRASGEMDGMRSTDLEILSQLVDDYGAAEVIRQLRQLPEKGQANRQKRGMSS